MPKIPDLPSVQNAHKEKLRTWEVLGTTQKYSWTTRAPPLKYATPLFAQLEPEKKRPIENSPDPRFAKEKVLTIFKIYTLSNVSFKYFFLFGDSFKISPN